MSDTKHTSGPWVLMPEFHGDHGQYYVTDEADGSEVACVTAWIGEHRAEAEVNARLIAAAPDHALVCWAMCMAAGRWEPSGTGGEFCINGIRYSTKLDEFGCPIVNGSIRTAISRAQGLVSEPSQS